MNYYKILKGGFVQVTDGWRQWNRGLITYYIHNSRTFVIIIIINFKNEIHLIETKTRQIGIGNYIINNN